MKIAIASDHAGFELKALLLDYLGSKGHEVKDFGTYTPESMDYPDTIHPLATAVEKQEYEMGFVLCGSGNGVAMTANKHQGIRCALCWNEEIAWLARLHNNANICSLPARFLTEREAREIADRFLETEFEGGRHLKRIEKIPVACN